MNGFKMACKEACGYIKENLSISVEDVGKDALISCAKTSMSSKIIGSESDFYAKMVVEGMT
jgi:T-complex protein 1 subunit alpha